MSECNTTGPDGARHALHVALGDGLHLAPGPAGPPPESQTQSAGAPGASALSAHAPGSSATATGANLKLAPHVSHRLQRLSLPGFASYPTTCQPMEK